MMERSIDVLGTITEPQMSRYIMSLIASCWGATVEGSLLFIYLIYNPPFHLARDPHGSSCVASQDQLADHCLKQDAHVLRHKSYILMNGEWSIPK